MDTLVASLPDYLLFNRDTTLQFTGGLFWIFFGLVLAIDACLYKKSAWRHAFLMAASLFFYYKTSGLFFLLLLFTVTSDFFIARRIAASAKKSHRLSWLVVSLVLDFGLLFYFKYAYFFTESANALFGTHYHVFNWLAHWGNSFFSGDYFTVSKIILPAGISFYTFQTVSYTIEVYRGKVAPVKRLTDYGFYVSFFPQLLAGPIMRATDFLPQLYKPYSLTKHQAGLGIFWILNGLLKKTLLADYLAANFINRVFDNPSLYSGFENLFALFGYSLQVYADFSGYSDIATGVALLMGIHLVQNFNSPYKARDVTDFWRRWHISLSAWLREYIYIPLGGNRRGSAGTWVAISIICGFIVMLSRSWAVLAVLCILCTFIVLMAWLIPALRLWLNTNLNLLITMLVGGLWHGPSWNFIIWGALNGAGLVMHKTWRMICPWKNIHNGLRHAAGIAVTFTFITFTRIWFRTGTGTTWDDFDAAHDIAAELSKGQAMIDQIFLRMDWSVAPAVMSAFAPVFALFAAGMSIHWLPQSWKRRYRHRFASLPVWAIVAAVFATVFIVYQVQSANPHPFIYFQF